MNAAGPRYATLTFCKELSTIRAVPLDEAALVWYRAMGKTSTIQAENGSKETRTCYRVIFQ